MQTSEHNRVFTTKRYSDGDDDDNDKNNDDCDDDNDDGDKCERHHFSIIDWLNEIPGAFDNVSLFGYFLWFCCLTLNFIGRTLFSAVDFVFAMYVC